MEEENKKEKHYVCLGGCKGVSKIPGTCSDPRCPFHNKGLTECDCKNDKHNDFKIDSIV
jgi:hypothetical protein